MNLTEKKYLLNKMNSIARQVRLGDLIFEDNSNSDEEVVGTLAYGEIVLPKPTTALTGVTRHVAFAIGEITGTTAYGFGDPTKPTYGTMISFGRVALATAAFSGTDTSLDVRAINKLANNAAYNLQAAYIKAKNYSTGTVGNLTGLFIEAVNDGTATSVIGLKIGSDGSTINYAIDLSAAKTNNGDIKLYSGAVIGSAVVSGTTLCAIKVTPIASVATGSITRHVLYGLGDLTGTTAFGFGDVTKSTYGLMACFGRTEIATSAFTGTDTALDARAINKLVNDAAYNMQGAYIKAKNYSTGVMGVLTGLFVEIVNDGTVSSATGIKIGSDGSTIDNAIDMSTCVTTNGADIKLSSGITIGSGADAPTHAAATGSLYIRTGQSDQKAMLYLCTVNSGTWVLLNTVTA